MIRTLTFSLLTIFLSIIVIGSQPVLAQDPACSRPPLQGTPYCNDQSNSNTNTTGGGNEFVGTAGVVNRITGILTTVVAVASILMVVVGGIMYALSNGDPSKTSRAKDTIIYAIVGLVVAMLSRQIVVFVLNRIATGA